VRQRAVDGLLEWIEAKQACRSMLGGLERTCFGLIRQQPDERIDGVRAQPRPLCAEPVLVRLLCDASRMAAMGSRSVRPFLIGASEESPPCRRAPPRVVIEMSSSCHRPVAGSI